MKVELVIPTSLSEIPLKHYQKHLEVVKNSNDPDFITQKMIQIFCGVELKDIVNIRKKDADELVDHFTNLFNTKPKFQRKFKIAGKEFGFIPDLENITLAEYVDLESNLSDWSTYHKAMAVMYRPITKKRGGQYDIEPYNGSATYAELMEFAPVEVCAGASLFFWTLEKQLLTAIPTYLEIQEKKMKRASFLKRRNSQSNGDGINQYINSLKETLPGLMKSPELNYTHALPSLRLKSKKTK